MLLLTGEYELTIDDKHRLSIPARLRNQVDQDEHGSAFYLVMGANRILSLYPDKYYQRIVLAVAPGRVAPDELLTYERVNFAMAGKVELDRQGRVLLNERAIRRADIKDQVTLIGARDHLEIWDVAMWDKYLTDNMAFQEEMLLKARQEAFRKQGEESSW